MTVLTIARRELARDYDCERVHSRRCWKSRFGAAADSKRRGRATPCRRSGLPRENVHEILRYLKSDVEQPYRMLYDLTAIDERVRVNRQGQPPSDFTVVYHLLSFERNEDIRIKVPLSASPRSHWQRSPSIWPSANWYEREAVGHVRHRRSTGTRTCGAS